MAIPEAPWSTPPLPEWPGLLGLYLHTTANLGGLAASRWDNFIDGAPSMAPPLFPNLVLLAGIGLWVLGEKLPATVAEPSPAEATS